MRTRIKWTFVGAAAVCASLAMATAVDRGVTHAWPATTRGLWAGVLLTLGAAGAAAILYGLGSASNAAPAAMRGTESTRDLPEAVFLATLVGSVLVAVAAAFYVEWQLGLSLGSGVFFTSGLMFLIAATGRPWWLYETIRRVDWFALISSDRVMRLLLGTFGAILFGLAFPVAGITWDGLPADSYVTRAHRAARGGDLVRARQLAERAIARDSSHAEARYVISGVCFEEKDYACAVQEARHALELKPTVGTYHEALAGALLGGGLEEESLEELRTAVNLDPSLERAWLSRARLAYMLGEFSEADSSYAMLQELNPDILRDLSDDRAMWESARALRP